MSQYTISLNAIINILDPNTEPMMKSKIDHARPLLFGYDYGVDDQAFKDHFEKGFILQYIDRDICFDTVDRWLLELQNDVEIKLPLFYKRYQAINSLRADLIDRLGQTTEHSSIKSDAHTSSESSAKSSQFPQDIIASQFDDIKYMDGGSKSVNNGDSDSTSTSDRTVTQTGNILDKLAVYDAQIKDIITEAIDSFNELFILVY